MILLSDNDLVLAEIDINTTLRKPIVAHFLKKKVQIVPLINLRADRAPNFVQSLVPSFWTTDRHLEKVMERIPVHTISAVLSNGITHRICIRKHTHTNTARRRGEMDHGVEAVGVEVAGVLVLVQRPFHVARRVS